MITYAHTAEDSEGRLLPESSGKWQPLADHLRNVSDLAAQFAAPFGAGAEASLAGLLHDLGKYQPNFQRYLAQNSPRTPHAIHGGAALSIYRNLANVIAGHHSGLHDEVETHTSNLRKLTSTPEGQALLKSLLLAYRTDGLSTPPKLPIPQLPALGDTTEDLRLRLLLSTLADADYLDTEEHFLRAAGKVRPSANHASIPDLRAKLDAHLQSFAARPSPSSLNQLRSRIAARCVEAGRTSPPGTFSLTVPTGGGKTLASAAFALHHAATHGFQRVIYVIPYTSIIEQNARVFASIFGAENILEHHSLADWQTRDETEDDPASPAARAKLASENWDAPFIVTTNVQFFESLHSHRPSAVRKLHRLLGSVVLFDECQTFPPELLDPSLATLQALQAYGKTSLVFCTATQPAFERREFFPAGFPSLTEIIPSDDTWRLHERPEFRRTRIHHDATPIALETFAQRIAACDRALAIVNTRRTARELFDAVQTLSPGTHVYHLSTFMCPAHRQAVFDAVRIRLAAPKCPCLVIATQLIEAGVDLDFPNVLRVLGPLDAILQAAGRCNREGRLIDATGQLRLGEVEVITLADSTLPHGIYQRATALAAKFLPTGAGGDISPAAIHDYFRELYHDTERDKHAIAHLREQRLHRTLGQKYRWIEEDQPTESVLTDYNDAARAWIAALEAQDYAPPTRPQRRAIARLSINLRASDVQRGLHAGILRQLHCGLYVTSVSHETQYGYDPRFGYNPTGVVTDNHTIF
jgi:CRISPR-associated endonuclease/helicase Cas3